MKTLGMMIARIAALLALAALSWASALYFDWPLWCAPAVFCAALAGWLLCRVARRGGARGGATACKPSKPRRRPV